MNTQATTITAISTAPMNAAVGLVRLSGPKAHAVAETAFSPLSGKKLSFYPSRTAVTGNILGTDGGILDTAVATLFKGPRSYTGEDMAEFSCHGGMVVLSEVVRRMTELGAVPAERGEFTLRAFLNRKMDLTQSEAVIDIINAKNELARKQAFLQAGGALKNRLQDLRGRLLNIDASIMVYVDYAAEGIEPPNPEEILPALENGHDALQTLLKSYETGRTIKNGVDAVICGRPNAGKSSVMNLLCGEERSIVTELAGTTRDIVESTVQISGLSVNLGDTAGIRSTEHIVEQIGVERAKERLGRADLLLCVFDGSEVLTPEDAEILALAEGRRAVAVVNKSDLPMKIERDTLQKRFEYMIIVSAKTGEGLKELRQAVYQLAAKTPIEPDALYLTNLRHFGTLREADEALLRAIGSIKGGVPAEIAETDLREALRLIGEVTGDTVTEDLIDRIFENFCVGK